MQGARLLRQRRYPRYRWDIPVRAHVYSTDTMTYPVRGRCCELGEGGAGASLCDQLPPGEVVSLELSPNLRVYAAVRYLRGYYHGFEFVMLRDRQRHAIQKLCAALAPRKPDAAAQSATASR